MTTLVGSSAFRGFLGTGTPGSGNFFRGDGVWETPIFSGSSNSLSVNTTIPADTSYVVIGYLNINGFSLIVEGNVEIL